MAERKPSTTLLILCSAAVAAAYTGAYIYTEPTAGASIAAGQALPTGNAAASSNAPAAAATSRSTSANAATSKATTSSNATTSKAAATSKTSPAKPGYKDGVYTGSGSNVYGQLSVAVTIAGGKITNVKITSYAMHYPTFYISPFMNNEFVKMQTYQVYGVSGATASSYNFAEAVYYALKKATA